MALRTAAKPPGASLTANRIESLLSARLFLIPRLTDGTLYFLSSLSGRLSLYSMDPAGGVPQPLLPPQIALQNPELLNGHSFYVLPELGRIVVMIDRDGDENYQPFVIPLDGGFPEPFAADPFQAYRSHLADVDPVTGIAYFAAESRKESMIFGLRADLGSGAVETLGQSRYGAVPAAWSPDHSRVVLSDEYLVGDVLLYERDAAGGRRVLYGTPLDEREDGQDYPPSGIRSSHGTASGTGVLLARLSGERVQHTFHFQVWANDAVSPDYQVQVLPPPTLVALAGNSLLASEHCVRTLMQSKTRSASLLTNSMRLRVRMSFGSSLFANCSSLRNARPDWNHAKSKTFTASHSMPCLSAVSLDVCELLKPRPPAGPARHCSRFRFGSFTAGARPLRPR